MDALYNRRGQVAAWLDRVAGEIVDLTGQHLAFVDDDSVYDYSGNHIGWWQNDHVRDSRGAVGFFTRHANSMGIYRPFLGFEPFQPYKAYSPYRPYKRFKPFRPFDMNGWSSESRWS